MSVPSRMVASVPCMVSCRPLVLRSSLAQTPRAIRRSSNISPDEFSKEVVKEEAPVSEPEPEQEDIFAKDILKDLKKQEKWNMKQRRLEATAQKESAAQNELPNSDPSGFDAQQRVAPIRKYPRKAPHDRLRLAAPLQELLQAIPIPESFNHRLVTLQLVPFVTSEDLMHAIKLAVPPSSLSGPEVPLRFAKCDLRRAPNGRFSIAFLELFSAAGAVRLHELVRDGKITVVGAKPQSTIHDIRELPALLQEFEQPKEACGNPNGNDEIEPSVVRRYTSIGLADRVASKYSWSVGSVK